MAWIGWFVFEKVLMGELFIMSRDWLTLVGRVVSKAPGVKAS